MVSAYSHTLYTSILYVNLRFLESFHYSLATCMLKLAAHPCSSIIAICNMMEVDHPSLAKRAPSIRETVFPFQSIMKAGPKESHFKRLKQGAAR